MDNQNILIPKKNNNSARDFFKKKPYWIKKYINTKIGIIPVIEESLVFKDILGEIKARIGINRHNYKINPGLYAIGTPDENSPVLVTANYKLTFDKLRKELCGLSFWIIVLDTKGINVWCAAGKGTFGTDELIKRIKLTRIKELINRNTIILPQLGAPGVDSFKALKNTGLKVKYGPVYAKDIRTYVENNFTKSQSMSRINFRLIDRIILTPIELNTTIIPNLIIIAVLFLLNLIAQNGFTNRFIFDYLPFLLATIVGGFLFPVALPYIPFHSFALKGAVMGFIFALLLSLVLKSSLILYLTNILLFVPVISFIALNFTGATTFTSLSGVKKEIKIATPLFIVSMSLGIILKVLSIFKVLV